mmetsp:Transcript_10248/g.31572  ORF Transcript_10248/g.31572 Transcript_10248/m.31572 type:complete len:492 (-) Transcript_10248:68-1543(-)
MAASSKAFLWGGAYTDAASLVKLLDDAYPNIASYDESGKRLITSHVHSPASGTSQRVTHGNAAYNRWSEVNKERTANRTAFLEHHGAAWLVERFSKEFPEDEEVFAAVLPWLATLATEYYNPSDADNPLNRSFRRDPGLDQCFVEVTRTFVKWPSHKAQYWKYLDALNVYQDLFTVFTKSTLAAQIVAIPQYATVYRALLEVVEKQKATLDDSQARILQRLQANVKKEQAKQDLADQTTHSFEASLQEGKFRADLFKQSSLQDTFTHHAPQCQTLMEDFDRGNDFSWTRQRNFVLHIHRIQCSNLAAADASMVGGKSDPYVLTAAFSMNEPYEHKHTKWTSSVLKKTLNPCWTRDGSVLEAPVGDGLKATVTKIPSFTLILNSKLILEFWDKDLLSSDDFLGSVTLEMACLHTLAHSLKKDPFELVLAIGGYERDMSTGMSKRCHTLGYDVNPAICTLTVSVEILNPELVKPPRKEDPAASAAGLAYLKSL